MRAYVEGCVCVHVFKGVGRTMVGAVHCAVESVRTVVREVVLVLCRLSD